MRSAVSLALVPLSLVVSLAGCADNGFDPKAPIGISTGSALMNGGLLTAIASPSRPEGEKRRDVFRHPAETLQFLGLRPDMDVIELAPGEGWYTAILAPTLADHGKLFVANGDPNGPPDSEGTKRARGLLARFAASPAVFGKVVPFVVDWKKPGTLGPDAAVDLVLTFRSAHGWIHAGNFDTVLAEAFRVLRPGGIFGLVEHRANPGASTDPKVIGDTGYVPEAFIIARAQAAGFKLGAKSEINANKKDTKDYPKGVWTLPPTFELGEVDHDRYAAIGESDRMTIKFIKP